jgi:hypothetical protein
VKSFEQKLAKVCGHLVKESRDSGTFFTVTRQVLFSRNNADKKSRRGYAWSSPRTIRRFSGAKSKLINPLKKGSGMHDEESSSGMHCGILVTLVR